MPRRQHKNKYAAQAAEARRRNHELKSCRAKKRYESEYQARARIHGLHAYECQYCSGWHLTKKLWVE